jgi:hypothetical protein
MERLAIVVLTVVTLGRRKRGSRFSAAIFATPTYFFFGQKSLDRLAFSLIDRSRQQVLKPPDICVARRFFHEQPPTVPEKIAPELFK